MKKQLTRSDISRQNYGVTGAKFGAKCSKNLNSNFTFIWRNLKEAFKIVYYFGKFEGVLKVHSKK